MNQIKKLQIARVRAMLDVELETELRVWMGKDSYLKKTSAIAVRYVDLLQTETILRAVGRNKTIRDRR